MPAKPRRGSKTHHAELGSTGHGWTDCSISVTPAKPILTSAKWDDVDCGNCIRARSSVFNQAYAIE